MNLEQLAPASPFHHGEQQAQDRMGVREKLDKVGRKHIRDHMPEQHREFYTNLPFVLLGAVDDQDRPWASIFAGHPGFMSTPDSSHLEITAQPLHGNPLIRTLKPGAEVGLLGIELDSRRRNRLNGRIRSAGQEGITIETSQTFGNCPKYIQTRKVEAQPAVDEPGTERPTTVRDHFDADTRSLIERSDTLFVATAHLDGSATAGRGVDISHRGGKPGFVKIEDDQTFVFPDFSGNLHFNTVGNILANPKAGFLFIDFDSGDLVYMTGTAEVVWHAEEIDAFAGAERMIRFRAETVIHVEGSLPLSFTFGEYSPNLERTGSWQQTGSASGTERREPTISV